MNMRMSQAERWAEQARIERDSRESRTSAGDHRDRVIAMRDPATSVGESQEARQADVGESQAKRARRRPAPASKEPAKPAIAKFLPRLKPEQAANLREICRLLIPEYGLGASIEMLWDVSRERFGGKP